MRKMSTCISYFPPRISISRQPFLHVPECSHVTCSLSNFCFLKAYSGPVHPTISQHLSHSLSHSLSLSLSLALSRSLSLSLCKTLESTETKKNKENETILKKNVSSWKSPPNIHKLRLFKRAQSLHVQNFVRRELLQVLQPGVIGSGNLHLGLLSFSYFYRPLCQSLILKDRCDFLYFFFLLSIMMES